MSARRTAYWPRITAIILIAVGNFFVLGMWTGRCDDYASELVESRCVIEPAVGAPGAWLITTISTIAIIVLTHALVVERRRRRRSPLEAGATP